jgi:hypothetical protein
MQREKLYNLRNKAHFNYVIFIFKKRKTLRDWFLQWQTLIVQSFTFFCKQKSYNLNTLYCVDCRAFHAASCGIFCFLNRMYLVVEK